MTFASNRPLLNFSTKDERATLLPIESELMPRRRRRGVAATSSRRITRSASGRKRLAKRRKGRRVKSTKGIRLIKGRLALRVAGYSGLQRIAPSQLVRFVPLSKLKTAAKRVLLGSHKGRKRIVKRRRRRHIRR